MQLILKVKKSLDPFVASLTLVLCVEEAHTHTHAKKTPQKTKKNKINQNVTYNSTVTLQV